MAKESYFHQPIQPRGKFGHSSGKVGPKDTITHDRLLLKLKGYGLDGQLLNWVKTF